MDLSLGSARPMLAAIKRWRFLSGIFADDGECHLAGPMCFSLRCARSIYNWEGRSRRRGRCCTQQCPRCEVQVRNWRAFRDVTDAFGEKYFLSDKRHGAGVRSLRGDMTCEILCCGKVTRRFWCVNPFPRFHLTNGSHKNEADGRGREEMFEGDADFDET